MDPEIHILRKIKPSEDHPLESILNPLVKRNLSLHRTGQVNDITLRSIMKSPLKRKPRIMICLPEPIEDMDLMLTDRIRVRNAPRTDTDSEWSEQNPPNGSHPPEDT